MENVHETDSRLGCAAPCFNLQLVGERSSGDFHDSSSFYDGDFATFAHLPTSPTEDQYLNTLIVFLVDLACKNDFIAAAMATKSAAHLGIESGSEGTEFTVEQHHFGSKLAAAMLQSEREHNCSGVVDLSPSYHDGLERMAKGLRLDATNSRR